MEGGLSIGWLLYDEVVGVVVVSGTVGSRGLFGYLVFSEVGLGGLERSTPYGVVGLSWM